jgi:hypothetical protein
LGAGAQLLLDAADAGSTLVSVMPRIAAISA